MFLSKKTRSNFFSRLLGAEYENKRGERLVNASELNIKMVIVLLSLFGIFYSSMALYANHADFTAKETVINAEKVNISFMSKGEISENGEIPVSKENFPDDVFREYILKTADLNFDESLNEDEVLNVKNIVLSNKEELKNLAGIEMFPNLEYLSIVNSPVSKLDFSSMPNIKTLRLSGSAINSLDLSSNNVLVTLEINNMTLGKIQMPENSSIATIKSHNTNIKCETENHIYKICKITD